MPSTIVLDCDGVILDWRQGFYEWIKVWGYTAVFPPHPADYTMITACPDKTEEQIRLDMARFNASEDFARLSFCEGAEAGVNALRAAFPTSRIVVLTAVGQSDRTLALRRRNLAVLPIDEVICVPLGASKRRWLETFARPGLIVEDHPDHAAEAIELGFGAILVDRPWNRAFAHHEIERVASWNEVVDASRRRLAGASAGKLAA